MIWLVGVTNEPHSISVPPGPFQVSLHEQAGISIVLMEGDAQSPRIRFQTASEIAQQATLVPFRMHDGFRSVDAATDAIAGARPLLKRLLDRLHQCVEIGCTIPDPAEATTSAPATSHHHTGPGAAFLAQRRRVIAERANITDTVEAAARSTLSSLDTLVRDAILIGPRGRRRAASLACLVHRDDAQPALQQLRLDPLQTANVGSPFGPWAPFSFAAECRQDTLPITRNPSSPT